MIAKWMKRLAGATALLVLTPTPPSFAQDAASKPNILVIMGDDIGYWNISAYNRGMMGYRTPNIDRIANEGAIFTDYYGQQSCTAGRAAFITGQSPMRTGLLRSGCRVLKKDCRTRTRRSPNCLSRSATSADNSARTISATAMSSYRPSMASMSSSAIFTTSMPRTSRSTPIIPRTPSSDSSSARVACSDVPRPLLMTQARTRASAVGKQNCEDTGPLDKKRMETVDQEFLNASLDFIDRANRDKKPFFAWFNSSRMHIWTRLKPESEGKTGLGLYPDGMVEHDGQVGQLLKKLDDLGIANNTIVIYTTDNGAETFTWPDGGTTPFRGEKNTNWEGSYRVPALVRWPALVKARTELNDIFSAEDWVPTLVAAAGDPDIKDKLLQGYDASGKTFKVHLDGYDQRDLLAAKGPDKRREFFYWTDDGNLAGLRFDQYKWCSWNSRRMASRSGCSL